MTQNDRTIYRETRRLIRLIQGLNLLNTGHTVTAVRTEVDAETADYWSQRMRAVPITPTDDAWQDWSRARRASLDVACRSLARPQLIKAPMDPAYGDWIPTRPERPMTTLHPTYLAAIATGADMVTDGLCDVAVAVAEEISTREAPDGTETPVHAMGDIVFGPHPTTVTTDDPEKLHKAQREAETFLEAAGWIVDGRWDIVDNQMYATVTPDTTAPPRRPCRSIIGCLLPYNHANFCDRNRNQNGRSRAELDCLPLGHPDLTPGPDGHLPRCSREGQTACICAEIGSGPAPHGH